MAIAAKSSALAREPLYLQVCELLTRQIASGVWKPNAALPNELELARELGVSTGTVRKALERLEADRLVMRRQGRGTFVIDQAGPEAASRFERLRHRDGDTIVWSRELLLQSSGAPTALEQRVLQIEPDEPVARRSCLLSTADRPFAVEEACLALTRLPGLAVDKAGDWNITCLAQQQGVHVVRAYEEVRLVPAALETAGLLAVKAGTALMELNRCAFSTDDAPIEWRRASCHMRDEYYLAEVN